MAEQRIAAAQVLISTLKKSYPEKGFQIHPSLEFVPGFGGGVEARVTKSVSKDEILLVIPDSARLSIANAPLEMKDIIVSSPSRYIDSPTKVSKTLPTSHLLEEIKDRFDAMREEKVMNNDKSPLPVGIHDISTTVLIMYAMAAKHQNKKNKGDDDWWPEQVVTWPSKKEIQETLPMCWDSNAMNIIRKSSAYENISLHKKELRMTFDRIVLPLLSDWGIMENFITATPPLHKGEGIAAAKTMEEQLWEDYLLAFSIMFSRSHGGGGTNGIGVSLLSLGIYALVLYFAPLSTFVSVIIFIVGLAGTLVYDSFSDYGRMSTPELIPLVELINGLPEGCCDDFSGNGVNVSFVAGYWPFLSGRSFKNECNLKCGCLYALRDLNAGESLLISYGDLDPQSFLTKYGCIPKEVLAHPDIGDTIGIWCPPELVLDPTDKPRIAALKQWDHPVTAEETAKQCLTFLDPSELRTLRNGVEPDSVKRLRQFLILGHLAKDEEVQTTLSTGRLRAVVTPSKFLKLLFRVIDYNIDNLVASDKEGIASTTSSSSARDVKLARKPTTSRSEAAAYLGRVCQREMLAKWRHAFCRKYKCTSHADDKNDVDLLGGWSSFLVGMNNYRYDFNPPTCLSNGGCKVCGRTFPLGKCTRCKDAYYCCLKHKKLDWENHKHICWNAKQLE